MDVLTRTWLARLFCSVGDDGVLAVFGPGKKKRSLKDRIKKDNERLMLGQVQ